MRMEQLKIPLPNKPFRFLIAMSKPHAPWMLGAFFAVTVAETISSSLPYFFKHIIDTATGSHIDFSQTEWWVFALIAVIAVMYIAWRAGGFVGMQWVTGVNSTAYANLFEYLSFHSPNYFSNRFAGSLTNKVSHASDGSERLADAVLWNYHPTIIRMAVSAALMFSASVLVGYVFVGLIAILIVMNVLLVQRRKPLVVKYASEHSVLRGKAVDIATNISAVWQFARRPFELGLLSRQIQKRRDADIAQWLHSEVGLAINNVLITVAVGYMFVFAFSSLKTGDITVGGFVMVMTLVFGMIGTLTFIGNMMNNFVRIYGEIEEGLTEILVPHDIVDETRAARLTVRHGDVVFDSVDFAYHDEVIFSGLHLTIPARQKIGIVGASGAGKTTLVSLLLRQHDIQQGSIRIDGHDIATVTQDSLRRSISIIPQESMLFHRTIRENIRYGNLKASDAEVEETAKRAQAHEFIRAAPEGYDTYVGERGIKLSGGQRQRIAVARALLKDAPILILDEATSSLDSESEMLIQKSLHTLVQNKTVLAIAHRLSTLREMDRIIVLDGGKIVQDGNHETLLQEKNGVYVRLWNHQAGGFITDEDE